MAASGSGRGSAGRKSPAVRGRGGTARGARPDSTCAAGMSRMQRWWTSRQVGLWQGRQGTSVAVSITAASGLSGAQCQGLVGPKMPTVGVPMAAATWNEAGIVRHAGAGGFSARMALRRSGDGQVARARAGGGAISAASGVSAGPPSTQTDSALGGELPRQLGEVADRPALARARPRPARRRPPAGRRRQARARRAMPRPRRPARRVRAAAIPPGAAAPFGSASARAAVDHAGQLPFRRSGCR